MNRPQHQQVATLPSFSSVGGIVVRGMGNFAKKHKVISGSYILGILFILLVGSGTKLSVDQAKRYDSIMNTIDIQAEYEASHRYAEALHTYRATKGWFSCDSLCQRNKQRMERSEAILQDVRREGYARMSDAKSVAGVFSEVGVDEVKDSFWGYFGAGKQFAKRQSMWDALFMGMRSMKRDESMVEYMLQMLMNLLINFSIGLIGALVVFVFGLWSIIKSYQPNPLTAVLFFIGASSAAFAFVSTYLFAMFGAAAGGVYGLAKVAESNARLQNGGGGRRQNVQNHAHHS